MFQSMTRARSKRTTVYLDSQVVKAAKIKAALSGKSVSDLANEGLVRLLREDARDLKILRARRKQRVSSYEDFIAQLEKSGDL